MIFITRQIIKKTAIIASWLVIWEFFYVLVNEPLFLAGPVQTLKCLVGLLLEKATYGVVLNTAGKILAGFVAALCTAVFAGYFAWRVPFIREWLNPVLQFFKSVPVASVIVLFLAWFSSGGISVGISAFVTFPLIYFEVLSALDGIDIKLLEMLKVYQVRWKKRIQFVCVPAVCRRLAEIAPAAVGMCIRAGVAAELIGVPGRTIGEKLYKAKIYLEIDSMFAWTVIIVVMSFLCEKIIIWLIGLLRRRIENKYV